MKKTLVAIAALTAVSAFAQSSVTLFGIVDAGFGRISGAGTSVTGVTNSGIASSRLGFRGTEDLGGGMSASFHLEGQLHNDVGQGGNQTTGLNFQRRSTVSLSGGFGEVRIGRDYTPHFWNTTVFDPFGTNGVGAAATPGMFGGTQAVRASNSVGYFLPRNLGGFYGQAMIAFGENTGGVKTNNYTGLRVGYANGPLDVAFGTGKTKGATSAADVSYNNIGASYDFGVVKPMLVWAQEKVGTVKVTGTELGATAPLGAGQLKAAYSRYTTNANSNSASKLALGYVHNLSKRTALYGTVARVSNSSGSAVGLGTNGLGPITPAAGGNVGAYEFGVRHSF